MPISDEANNWRGHISNNVPLLLYLRWLYCYFRRIITIINAKSFIHRLHTHIECSAFSCAILKDRLLLSIELIESHRNKQAKHQFMFYSIIRLPFDWQSQNPVQIEAHNPKLMIMIMCWRVRISYYKNPPNMATSHTTALFSSHKNKIDPHFSSKKTYVLRLNTNNAV